MKQVQKSISYEKTSYNKMDLSTYRKSKVNSQNTSLQDEEQLHVPLAQVLTVAAFMFVPLASSTQCLINSYSVDVNRDGDPDIMIYSTFKTGGYVNALRSINQVRARAVNASNQITFFGTQFFPRSCYYNNCVFPTPAGATTGIRMGDVAVLRERILSCTYFTTAVKNTNTYTISGVTYTSCFTTFVSSTNCNPVVNNGNFQIGMPSTLAFQLNNQEFHFIELTLDGSGATVNKIDGVTAQICEPGCQTTLELTCNEIFPIDSYHADNNIVTNDIVDVSRMVELKAGSEIELLPGFEVLQSGTFVAEIDPNCN